MVNQFTRKLILATVYAIVVVIKSGNAAYYDLNQNPQDLVDNEELISGFEPSLLSQRLQEINSLRNVEPTSENGYPVITEDVDWPKNDFVGKLGQVAGIAAHKNNSLYIFHRGNHVWDHRSFDLHDHYKKIGSGPIANDTVIVVDGQTGKVIKSWGANKFYMPHGISLDSQGNIWLTDVALQQVFRFKHDNLERPDLVLGQPFEPGNDWDHFCLPTDVVISSNGIAYIADGYCNSRILIVSPTGKIEYEIGIKDQLNIPHSLVLLEDENLICVADRDNRRILCYTAGLDRSVPGILTLNIALPRLNRIFSIEHLGDLLFALSVPDDESQSEGITFDLAIERIANVWRPFAGFSQPHDLTVSLDGKSLFVSDIDPKGPKIYKFNM